MKGPGEVTVQSRFGPAAEKYATSEIHARGDSLDLLLQQIQPATDWRVLDVATGAGHTAFTFAPHVGSVVALDLTYPMLLKTRELSAARGLENIAVVAGDSAALPVKGGLWDAVTCRLSFHHFSDPIGALAEFRRALRPGGVLGLADNTTVDDAVAAEYYNAYERLRDPSHRCVYSLERLQEMVEHAGFRIESHREFSKELDFESWVDRQEVSAEDRTKLLEMMRTIPEPLRALFAPRWVDEALYFSLWEAVLIARAC